MDENYQYLSDFTIRKSGTVGGFFWSINRFHGYILFQFITLLKRFSEPTMLHHTQMKNGFFSDISVGVIFLTLTHKRRLIMKNRIRSRNHFQLLACLTLLCAIGISITGCHERGRSIMERIDPIMEKFARELNLDDSQKIKLDAIKEEIRKTRSQLADRRNERFNELLVQVRSDQMDAKWMKQQVETYTETVLQNSDRFIELIVAFQKSLHPEQKEALAALMQKHKEKMKIDMH
jgi:Spy/CpxP family protein refolding chaperone